MAIIIQNSGGCHPTHTFQQYIPAPVDVFIGIFDIHVLPN
jgi:hypothetical protein